MYFIKTMPLPPPTPPRARNPLIFLDSLGGVEVALGGVTPRKKKKNMKREAEVA